MQIKCDNSVFSFHFQAIMVFVATICKWFTSLKVKQLSVLLIYLPHWAYITFIKLLTKMSLAIDRNQTFAGFTGNNEWLFQFWMRYEIKSTRKWIKISISHISINWNLEKNCVELRNCFWLKGFRKGQRSQHEPWHVWIHLNVKICMCTDFD